MGPDCKARWFRARLGANLQGHWKRSLARSHSWAVWPYHADASEGRGLVWNWQLWQPLPGMLAFQQFVYFVLDAGILTGWPQKELEVLRVGKRNP